MNGTSIAGATNLPGLDPASWQLAAQGDYNNDGKTDIFLHNQNTGDNAVWLMNGSTITAAANLPSLPPGSSQLWQPIA